jgi:hypothetical protein
MIKAEHREAILEGLGNKNRLWNLSLNPGIM